MFVTCARNHLLDHDIYVGITHILLWWWIKIYHISPKNFDMVWWGTILNVIVFHFMCAWFPYELELTILPAAFETMHKHVHVIWGLWYHVYCYLICPLWMKLAACNWKVLTLCCVALPQYYIHKTALPDLIQMRRPQHA